MTTAIIERPKTKRKYNRVKPSKINPVKVANLLSNPNIGVTDAAKILNCSRNAIYGAMQRSEIVISEYDIDSIKDNELNELYIITSEARSHLYKLLKAGKLKGIETTAILDRCFQQRRELQGKGHSSINIFTLIVQKADEQVLNITPTSTISSTPAVDNQPIVSDTDNSTMD